MPSTRGFPVHVHPSEIAESEDPEVERDERLDTHDRHAQLGGAEERGVSAVTLQVEAVHATASAEVRSIMVRRVAEDLGGTETEHEDRLGGHRDGEVVERLNADATIRR